MKTIKLLDETVKLDRTFTCDFCSERKKVGRCSYGTTHYTRLVCEQCANKINKYHGEVK